MQCNFQDYSYKHNGNSKWRLDFTKLILEYYPDLWYNPLLTRWLHFNKMDLGQTFVFHSVNPFLIYLQYFFVMRAPSYLPARRLFIKRCLVVYIIKKGPNLTIETLILSVANYFISVRCNQRCNSIYQCRAYPCWDTRAYKVWLQ